MISIRVYEAHIPQSLHQLTLLHHLILLSLSLIQGRGVNKCVCSCTGHILPKMRSEKGVCVILFVVRLVCKVHCAPSLSYTMHNVSHACRICVNLVK
jgi:hypothetical protein